MNENKPKYLVVDIKEWRDVLGKVDTLKEVRGLCKERVNDTEGDCYVVYYELDEKTNKYSMESMKIANY